ncbi:lipid droplet-associated hydrolase-like [Corticium candelabrum]|uniref:lipid droplet-associated hydrolase-like n=1 Tax=Corticium candelabrum TaxID=121492 RepID=UPI002E26971A|nr:lipid droplet-associated hydrolase-like [Corticium candelabrum]
MSEDHAGTVCSDDTMTVQDVNGQPTQVLTYGSVEEDADHIVFIPGVPGVIGLYSRFLESLTACTDGKFRIHALSHPGQDPSGLTPQQRGAVLSVEEQIEHKIAFIKTVVPNGSKLILIGHSLGCYMVLQMLKREVLVNFEIVKVGFICPVIARMRESRNGSAIASLEADHPILGKLASGLLRVFSALPRFCLKRVLNSYYVNAFGAPDGYRRDLVMKTLEFAKCHPCLASASAIGVDAVAVVDDMDVDTLLKLKDRLSIWYTQRDDYVPKGMYEELSKEYPELNIHEVDFQHAFNVHAADEMAESLSVWIKSTAVDSVAHESMQ